MEIKYKNYKDKEGYYEIHLNESLSDTLNLFNIDISLECYEDSKSEAIAEFDNRRKFMSNQLRMLADEIESFDLKTL